MITQKGRNYGDHLAMLQHLQLSQIFKEKNSCCVFGGTILVSCIMSCSNRTKILLSTEHNWWDWVEQLRKTVSTITPDTTKLFSCMIMHVHMLRRRSKPIWKHSSEKFYPTRRIHQTLLNLISTYFDRWRMACLSSTSHHIKIPKIGSIVDSLKRWSILPT